MLNCFFADSMTLSAKSATDSAKRDGRAVVRGAQLVATVTPHRDGGVYKLSLILGGVAGQAGF
jgi:hypothetical protein